MSATGTVARGAAALRSGCSAGLQRCGWAAGLGCSVAKRAAALGWSVAGWAGIERARPREAGLAAELAAGQNLAACKWHAGGMRVACRKHAGGGSQATASRDIHPVHLEERHH